jgi:hypothetical protein
MTLTKTNYTKINKLLKDQGYIVSKVEQYNKFSQHKKDLFGFIDILAIKPGEILGIQATGWTFHGSHANNYLNNPKISKNIEIWLSTGAKFEIWAYNNETKKFKIKSASIQTYPCYKLRFIDC